MFVLLLKMTSEIHAGFNNLAGCSFCVFVGKEPFFKSEFHLSIMFAHRGCIFLLVSLEIVTMNTRLSLNWLSHGAGMLCHFDS